jgi:hypothetical protein
MDYDILGRFWKPDKFIVLCPVIQLRVDVGPSVRRSLCFLLSCMTSVLTELIGFHKNNYPCLIFGDFLITVYFFKLIDVTLG